MARSQPVAVRRHSAVGDASGDLGVSAGSVTANQPTLANTSDTIVIVRKPRPSARERSKSDRGSVSWQRVLGKRWARAAATRSTAPEVL